MTLCWRWGSHRYTRNHFSRKFSERELLLLLREEKNFMYRCVCCISSGYFLETQKFSLVGLFSRKFRVQRDTWRRGGIFIRMCIIRIWWGAKILPCWMGYNFLREFLLKKRNIEINEIEVYKYRNRKNYRRNLREITSNFNETAYINRLPETKKVCNIRKNDIIVFKLRLFIIRVKMKFN